MIRVWTGLLSLQPRPSWARPPDSAGRSYQHDHPLIHYVTLCHYDTVSLWHKFDTLEKNYESWPLPLPLPTRPPTLWHYVTLCHKFGTLEQNLAHWSKTMTMTADHCHGTFNWTSLQQDILTGCFLFSKTWPWPWPFLQSLWPWRPQSYNFSSKPNNLTS